MDCTLSYLIFKPKDINNMGRKQINHHHSSFEHEHNLTPERQTERKTEKEPGGEQSDEQRIAATRQRNALTEIQEKQMLNAVYGMETEDETLKDHFDIHYFGEYPEDRKSTFKIRQEYDLQIICGYTKCDFPQQKIGMYVYPTVRAKQEADPNHSLSKASFRSNEFRIYRVWGAEMEQISFPHEVTHAVTHTWTTPYNFKTTVDTHDGQKLEIHLPIVSTAFFQEGLAVAVDELAFGYKLKQRDERKWPDEYIKERIERHQSLPTISSLILWSGFSNSETAISMPMAASFTKYLLTQYGISKFKEYYISLKEHMSIEEIEAITKQIFGVDLSELESVWKETLIINMKI